MLTAGSSCVRRTNGWYQFDENGNEKGTEVVQVRVGTEFVQETQEEVVGSPENPKIEVTCTFQQNQKIQLGPIQGNEAEFH